jgi:hypothetical protein
VGKIIRKKVNGNFLRLIIQFWRFVINQKQQLIGGSMPKNNSKEELTKEYPVFCFTELSKYLQQLNEEIYLIKKQIIIGLELIESGNFSAWIVNNKQLKLLDLAKAARIIMEGHPSYVFINYDWMFAPEKKAWSTFKRIEEYIEKLPGAKLPEKTLAVSEWFEKMEKTTHKGEGK